jgi:hypothetical protein
MSAHGLRHDDRNRVAAHCRKGAAQRRCVRSGSATVCSGVMRVVTRKCRLAVLENDAKGLGD